MPAAGGLRGGGRWIFRALSALSILGFLGFGALVLFQLREGFEKRSGELSRTPDAVAEEPEEVVSRAIEFTQFDERGRPFFQVRADEAFGPSDGNQRFLGVEVRLLEVYGGEDAFIAADELLVETRTEALEFRGNALLSVEGLELAGPRLLFRRNPDRVWFPDAVQFVSDDFIGVAASLNFAIWSGQVTLRGVVAEPVEADGFSVVAGRAVFDRESGDTTFLNEVEIASEAVRLTSRRSVTAVRDGGRMRSLSAGFGTALRITDGDGAEAVFRGGEIEIELEDGSRPRVVHGRRNPVFSNGSVELSGARARLDLDADGRPERLAVVGEVESRFEVEGTGVVIEAGELETGLAEGESARYRGGVEARSGRSRASAEAAEWNGEDTLRLSGAPRVLDSSLVELEAEAMDFVLGEASRIEAEGSVAARFLPQQLGFLPGEFDGAGLVAGSTTVESGTGRAAFSGGVRLLFGSNRLAAEAVEVDAKAGTLAARGEVATALAFTPSPEGAESLEPSATPGGVESPESTASPDGAEPPESTAPDGAEQLESAALDGAGSLAFAVAAERFSWDADSRRLAWEGSPRLDHRPAVGEPRRVTAGRIEAELGGSDSLRAVVGVGAARFERGSDRVRGSRIRFDPAADRLEAWGSPAVLEVEGRLSEGGRLDLLLDGDRSEIGATRTGRVLATVRIEGEPERVRRRLRGEGDAAGRRSRRRPR